MLRFKPVSECLPHGDQLIIAQQFVGQGIGSARNLALNPINLLAHFSRGTCAADCTYRFKVASFFDSLVDMRE